MGPLRKLDRKLGRIDTGGQVIIAIVIAAILIWAVIEFPGWL